MSYLPLQAHGHAAMLHCHIHAEVMYCIAALQSIGLASGAHFDLASVA
jgi:hypothetical protein